MEAKVAYSYAS